MQYYCSASFIFVNCTRLERDSQVGHVMHPQDNQGPNIILSTSYHGLDLFRHFSTMEVSVSGCFAVFLTVTMKYWKLTSPEAVTVHIWHNIIGVASVCSVRYTCMYFLLPY